MLPVCKLLIETFGTNSTYIHFYNLWERAQKWDAILCYFTNTHFPNSTHWCYAYSL